MIDLSDPLFQLSYLMQAVEQKGYSDDQQVLKDYVQRHPEDVNRLSREHLTHLVMALSQPTTKTPKNLPNGRVINQPTEHRLMAIACMIKCKLDGGTFNHYAEELDEVQKNKIIKPKPYHLTPEIVTEFFCTASECIETKRPSQELDAYTEKLYRSVDIPLKLCEKLGMTQERILKETHKQFIKDSNE